MTFLSALAKLNRATVDYPKAIEAYAHDDRALEKALALVPYLYFFLLYKAFSLAAQWKFSPSYSADRFHPIWPVAWLSYFDFAQAVIIIPGLFLLGMTLASFFFSHRIARIFAFLTLFQYHAFVSSFGAPDHTIFVWIYPLLFLIFLPDLWKKEKPTFLEKKKFLVGFLGVQIYIGVIYSLAGLGKVVRGLEQLLAGQANFLSPDAFALHIANWLPNLGSESLLGPFIIWHPLVGWPLFLGMLYFQVFTLFAIFRPALHWLWGIFLILFYIFNFLTMDIVFVDTFFLIAALLLNSPFSPPRVSLRDTLCDLPIFGIAFRSIAGARGSTQA